MKMKKTTSLILIALLGGTLTQAAEVTTDNKNQVLHAKCGHLMDKSYYDAGTAVDILRYDLQLLKKQGVDVPADLIAEAVRTDHQLREQWLVLERKRQQISEQFYLPKPRGSYLLSVENMAKTTATSEGWIGFRSFELVWKNGDRLEFPLKSFLRAAYKSDYGYMCEPSPAVFVYGKRSKMHTMATVTTLPKRIPSGNARLIVSGLDCDKEGRPTSMIIYMFGEEIYSGPNPFKKNGWSEVTFDVPERIFQDYLKNKGGKNDMEQVLVSFLKEIEAFKKQADRASKDLQTRAAPWLAQRLPVEEMPLKPAGWWTNRFILAMDVNDSLYGESIFVHPGMYNNMEYVAKACSEIGVNLASIQVGRGSDIPATVSVVNDFAKHATFPVLPWGSNPLFIGGDMIQYDYFGDMKKLISDSKIFIEVYKNTPNFAGIQVDEPVIDEANKKKGNLLGNSKVLDAYKAYIKERTPELLLAGVKNIPSAPFAGKFKTADDFVLYVEWQLFKKEYMADHYQQLTKEIIRLGWMPSIVIMDRNRTEPQMCSYVSMGSSLDSIGTDLYNNGRIQESMAMQLLQNSTEGQAIMWPGAGYACKSPVTFRRSLATGLTHADGLHIWTYVYCSKYRDPNFFWKMGGRKPNRDDRGRDMLGNWHPDFWNITKEMYQLAERAEPYLLNRKSLANAAVLVSERTLISRLTSDNRIVYWNQCKGVYSDLLGSGTPVDICFVETLRADQLARYKLLVLPNASALLPSEIKMLMSWVEQGGTLIASGTTSTKDQWGRDTQEPGLRSLWSDAKRGSSKVARKSTFGKGTVYYMELKTLGSRKVRIANSGLSGTPKNPQAVDFMLEVFNSFGATLPMTVSGLPDGVECQLQQSGSNYIIHLVDWFNDQRRVEGILLEIKQPGEWSIIYPDSNAHSVAVPKRGRIDLNGFETYMMVVVKKK